MDLRRTRDRSSPHPVTGTTTGSDGSSAGSPTSELRRPSLGAAAATPGRAELVHVISLARAGPAVAPCAPAAAAPRSSPCRPGATVTTCISPQKFGGARRARSARTVADHAPCSPPAAPAGRATIVAGIKQMRPAVGRRPQAARPRLRPERDRHGVTFPQPAGTNGKRASCGQATG